MDSLGIQLVESSEGYVDHEYLDSAGNPTICYGHLITAGQTFPATMTQAQCTALLQQDLGSAQTCVQNSVNVPLNENQFSALVDFAFNLGCGALQGSTLLRLLNQGQYTAVPAQMMRWTYAGGRQLPGLVTRRQNEGTLWNTPVSGASTAGAVTTAPPATAPATQAPSAAPATTAPAAPATTAQAAAATTAAGTAAPTQPPSTAAASGTTAGFFEAVAPHQGRASAVPTYAVVLIVCAAAVAVLLVGGVAFYKFRSTSSKEEEIEPESEGLLETIEEETI